MYKVKTSFQRAGISIYGFVKWGRVKKEKKKVRDRFTVKKWFKESKYEGRGARQNYSSKFKSWLSFSMKEWTI
jgi:hypothetical protein